MNDNLNYYICACCDKRQYIKSLDQIRIGQSGTAQVCFACDDIDQIRMERLLEIDKISNPSFFPNRKLVVSKNQYDYLTGICECDPSGLVIDWKDN